MQKTVTSKALTLFLVLVMVMTMTVTAFAEINTNPSTSIDLNQGKATAYAGSYVAGDYSADVEISNESASSGVTVNVSSTSGNFILSKSSASLATSGVTGDTTTVTVTPKTLPAGDYSTTITITGNGIATKTITATFTVTAASVQKSTDATLKSLTYNLGGVGKGTQIVIEGFSPKSYTYDVVLPYGTPIGSDITINGTPNDTKAKGGGTDTRPLSDGITASTLTVTAEAGNTQTYTVNFTIGKKAGETDEPADIHTVTFVYGNGSKNTVVEVKDGEKVKQPTNPTRSGYTFNGWYMLENGGGDKWDFNIPVKSNKTLYAYWTANSKSTGSTSSSGSSGGGGGGGSAAARSSTPTPAPISQAAAVNSVNDAVAAAKNAPGGATVKLQNVTTVSLSTLREMAKAAGNTALKVNADSLNPDGSVDVRITIDPSKATKEMNLSASTSSVAAQVAKMKFEKYFNNAVSTVSLSQKGNFGTPVRVAAKVDKNLNAETLVFYAYDSETNTFAKIENPEYKIDKNGYVHFTTAIGGDIIISDKPLKKK